MFAGLFIEYFVKFALRPTSLLQSVKTVRYFISPAKLSAFSKVQSECIVF